MRNCLCDTCEALNAAEEARRDRLTNAILIVGCVFFAGLCAFAKWGSM